MNTDIPNYHCLPDSEHPRIRHLEEDRSAAAARISEALESLKYARSELDKARNDYALLSVEADDLRNRLRHIVVETEGLVDGAEDAAPTARLANEIHALATGNHPVLHLPEK